MTRSGAGVCDRATLSDSASRRRARTHCSYAVRAPLVLGGAMLAPARDSEADGEHVVALRLVVAVLLHTHRVQTGSDRHAEQ